VRHQSLLETNPYLKDPDKYQKALITNVSSSTAIETGASVESIARTLTESKETDRIKKRPRSGR
jgi:hypothetical protein